MKIFSWLYCTIKYFNLMNCNCNCYNIHCFDLFMQEKVKKNILLLKISHSIFKKLFTTIKISIYYIYGCALLLLTHHFRCMFYWRTKLYYILYLSFKTFIKFIIFLVMTKVMRGQKDNNNLEKRKQYKIIKLNYFTKCKL